MTQHQRDRVALAAGAVAALTGVAFWVQGAPVVWLFIGFAAAVLCLAASDAGA